MTLLQVVEASAEADKLVSRTHESEAEVELLRDFVVAIPTMNAVHGQDSWQGQHVSEKYADHSAWDVHDIVAMLRRFFAVSEALSLPDLAEYEWRLDKVWGVTLLLLGLDRFKVYQQADGLLLQAQDNVHTGGTAYMQALLWCQPFISHLFNMHTTSSLLLYDHLPGDT